MAKKIKVTVKRTGETYYADESVFPDIDVLVKQRLIPGIRAVNYSEMNEEEQRLYSSIKNKSNTKKGDDTTETKNI